MRALVWLDRTGTFLVRGPGGQHASEKPGPYSISVRVDDPTSGPIVEHLQVRVSGRGFSVWTEMFRSLNELVRYHHTHPLIPGSPLRLLHPMLAASAYSLLSPWDPETLYVQTLD
jgi:hypothetical protein